MAIQILRLKDGSDIICTTNIVNPDAVELHYPMLFDMMNQRLVLQHWLPMGAIRGTSVFTILVVQIISEPSLSLRI